MSSIVESIVEPPVYCTGDVVKLTQYAVELENYSFDTFYDSVVNTKRGFFNNLKNRSSYLIKGKRFTHNELRTWAVSRCLNEIQYDEYCAKIRLNQRRE